MRILRTSIFFIIVFTMTFSQLSCTSITQRSILYRILGKLKYRITEISAELSPHIQRYDAIFLQDLKHPPTETEIQDMQKFVRKGGTLIVSGGNVQAIERLAESYGLQLKNLPNRLEYTQRNSEQPFFPLHPVKRIYARAYYIIDPLERDTAVLYGTNDSAVVLTLRDGEGRIFITTSSYLFTKNGLRFDGNATLLYNLMSTLPRKAHIGLAEGKYYTRGLNSPDSFTNFVFKTPVGLTAVYICLILFVFLTLRGRRFGTPLDVREDNRRLSSEYVHAMTALYQKGNTRMEILRHLRENFLIDLGTRWRVNPNLDTPTLLDELSQRGADDEYGILTKIINDLETSDTISESQLLDIAKRIQAYRDTSKF